MLTVILPPAEYYITVTNTAHTVTIILSLKPRYQSQHLMSKAMMFAWTPACLKMSACDSSGSGKHSMSGMLRIGLDNQEASKMSVSYHILILGSVSYVVYTEDRYQRRMASC